MAWFYAQNGQQRGPVELAELRGMLADGRLTRQDLVWTEGMPQWQPAQQVPTVMPASAAIDVAVAPVAAPQPIPGSAEPPFVAAYQSPYPTYAQPSRDAGLALTSMILSLVSIAFGGLFLAIPGAICGHIALKHMRATGDFRNRGFALTGFWVGLIWSLLQILLIVGIIVAVIVGASAKH